MRLSSLLVCVLVLFVVTVSSGQAQRREPGEAKERGEAKEPVRRRRATKRMRTTTRDRAMRAPRWDSVRAWQVPFIR